MKKIPPFQLIPRPLTDDAAQLPGFRFAGQEVGKRHQLGGEPTRPVEDEHWPRCADCRERMTFYGQLDSINDEYCVADAGLICVYVCFECCEVHAEIDSA
jgi:hypothetical protein